MKVIHHIRNRHFFGLDLLMILLAVYLSYVIRFEGFVLTANPLGISLILFATIAVLVTPATFWMSGVYSRFWRYASIDELLLLGANVLISTALVSFITFLITSVAGGSAVPRTIPVIYFMFLLALTAGPRLAIRFIGSTQIGRNNGTSQVPVVIMGAGDAGELTLREMRKRPELGMDVVGFLDDDARKHGVRIHGVPVLGDRNKIKELVTDYNVKMVLIAIPTATGKTIREIMEICESVGVRTQTLPGIYELLDGTVSVNQLRNVEIEDLLRRDPVRTDVAAVRELVKGKRVLITGGGGSIGGELCHQVLRCNPSMLIILGHGENSVFTIHNDLQRALLSGGLSTSLTTVIADTRDEARIRHIFEQHKPEIVFHAAAHKHVPLMELNPSEAITTNVMGTRNVLKAAQAVGVSNFVMISSDKAVNPTSIMGASKRVAELLVQEAAFSTQRPYVTVRFGNVLGSRGSVVLTFKQQIAAGGPVTVTDPEMVRYFMTIPEAVQLVLQASVLGKCGEVFVLDMGDPVKIVDLARDLIDLSGPKAAAEIEIVFTGIRPGEKLYEEMFISDESHQRTKHEKIFIANHRPSLQSTVFDEKIEALIQAAAKAERGIIVERLKAIIPEYTPYTPDSNPPPKSAAVPPHAPQVTSTPPPISQQGAPSVILLNEGGK